MNYIFFGSPRFASIVLKQLLDAGMPPIAIAANPDRPVGRKQVITAPLTKQLIAERNPAIKVLQPEKLDAQFIEELTALKPDLFVVAAYAKIIPQSVLEIARLGTLGTHPSLLPKYRGSSPIQSAILAGEAETGTTIYAMDAKMDHGPIAAQEKMAVGQEETYTSLEEKLAILSGALLVKTIPGFAAGTIKLLPQDETLATFTKKFSTEDGFVGEKDLQNAQENSNEEHARIILQKINALNPEPGSWTLKDGKRMKLLEAKISAGKLILIKTQIEGEKPKVL